MLEALIATFEAGLDQLRHEVDSYRSETNLWRLDGQVNNTAGNLAVHVVGNLQHFIGGQLGQTGYVRDRPAEFSVRDVPREEIIQKIIRTRRMIREVLSGIPERDLDMKVEPPPFDTPQTLARWLMHLIGHLHYHLGQVSYHRRLLDG